MIVQQRGKRVALAGGVLQILLTGIALAVWVYTHSLAAMAALWFLIAGVPVWLMVALLMYVRQLDQQEADELHDLTVAGGGRIFDPGDPASRPAKRRVQIFERWVTAIFTLMLAVLLMVACLLTLRFLSDAKPVVPENAAAGIIFSVLAAFGAFLFSRYALGMSERREWRVLRAVGSYQTVAAMVLVIVAISLVGGLLRYFTLDLVLAYAATLLLGALAVELLINFILELYRPRMPGQEERFSFDSRLFNLISQPGQIGHSLAETLNYQFGFEVSRTWFYQLISRALPPLLMVGALVMLAMSCVVVVEQGQTAAVLRWGQYHDQLGPGLHTKWPWPAERVWLFDTGSVHRIELGVGAERTAEQIKATMVPGESKGRRTNIELQLWKDTHGEREEQDVVIAAPPRPNSQAPALNLIKLEAIIDYRIRDIRKFGFGFASADKTLEYLAWREFNAYLSSATLDRPTGADGGDRPEAIMSYGRQAAAEALTKRLRAAAEETLGIEIVTVGLSEVHPPPKVAPAYERVLESERRRQTMRYEANAEAGKTLTEAAGEPTSALLLALSIRRQAELEKLADRLSNSREQFDRQLQEAIDRANGDLRGLSVQTVSARRMPLATTAPADDNTSGDLRAAYAEYLANLEQIRVEAGKGDAAGVRKILETQIVASRAVADKQFDRVSGQAAAMVAQAQANRWTKTLAERAKGATFASHLAAYNACPEVYMTDRYLDAWDEALPGMVKFVVLVKDRQKLEKWVDWKRVRGLMEGIRFEQPQAGQSK